jgi:acyl carrier protein
LFNFLYGVKMADLKEKVTKIIVAKLGVEESQITDDANFTKDLGADSLDTVELIMEFEKEFDLTIEDSDAEKIQTVGNVVEYLNSKLG